MAKIPSAPHAALALVSGGQTTPTPEVASDVELDALISQPVEVSPMPVKLGAQVLGETGEIYFVTYGSYYGQPFKGWSCTCQDFFYRHREAGTRCKHVQRVVQMFLPERFVF